MDASKVGQGVGNQGLNTNHNNVCYVFTIPKNFFKGSWTQITLYQSRKRKKGVMSTCTYPPCQQQASAVRCSIVGETNFNSVSWQLMGVRCTQDLVPLNLGIDNLQKIRTKVPKVEWNPMNAKFLSYGMIPSKTSTRSRE